jgi:HEAT repeat protein
MKRLLGVLGIVLCVSAARGAEVSELVKQLQSEDNDARRMAAKALGEGGAESRAAVPALIKALRDHDTFVRRFSAQALGDIGPEAHSAVSSLALALDDPKKEVRSAAAYALSKLGPSGVETLIRLVRDDSKDTDARHRAIDALSNLGRAGHVAVPALTEVLKEKAAKGKGKKKVAPDDLRVSAAVALGSLANAGDSDTIKTLESFTDKKAKAPRDLKQAANQALRKIRKNK